MRSHTPSLPLTLLLTALPCLAATLPPRAAAADNHAETLLTIHEWPVAGVRRVRMLRCLRAPLAGLAACDLSVDGRGRAAKLLRFGEGPGVGLGLGRSLFHPGATLAGGYDSNVSAASQFARGGAFLEAAMHLRLGHDAPPVPGQVVAYDLHAGLRYREFISDSDSVKELRALDPFVGAGLTLFPGGRVSVTLHNDFARLTRSPDNGLGTPLDVDRDRASALVAVRPGLGLVLELEYAATFTLAEESANSWYNQLLHAFTFSGRLPVGLPGMALTLNARQELVTRLDPDAHLPGVGLLPAPDDAPLRITAGFVGPFGTPGTLAGRFYALVEAGYGNSISEQAPTFSSFVGTLELGHRTGPLDWLRVGFCRDFAASTWGLSTEHAIYAAYDALYGWFQLGASVAFRHTSTDSNPNLPYTSSLEINLLRLHLGLDARILDWLYAGLHYDLDLADPVEAPMAVGANFEYTRHVVVWRAGVSY